MSRLARLFLIAAGVASTAIAQTPTHPPELSETIQVTATRIPADVLDVPASVTVVSGSEIEARGARDLASALSLAAGVAIAPGGDGGPASSVPELMGLREFDAFLLVVDGVPWGGAFVPALSSVDLTNVDRIEILRGSAPVLYGATSFVGVIHVIHRTPEQTPHEVAGSLGSRGSGGFSVTAPLGAGSAFRHSISAGIEREELSGDAGGFDRAHALWNGHGEAGGGSYRLTVDLTGVRQDPSSPHPREGRELSDRIPVDSNHNPSDAGIDENRVHFAAGYDHRLGAADWSTTVALTASERDTIRGFLREQLDDPEENAAGYRQNQEQSDLFFDSHLAWSGSETLQLVAGVDLLAGKGTADSELFGYAVGLDGSGRPPSQGREIEERPEFEDERTFAGAYVQALWTPTSRWRLEAGARLNHTREKQEGEVEGEDGEMRAEDERTDTRLSGGLGASFRAWSAENDSLWIYADWKDAFKPAAVDFGPEAEGEILDPETATTCEVGLKGAHLGGRLGWQASVFRMDFDNLVVARTVNGRPALENAGQQRFEGFELEGRWRIGEELTLQASYADHSAKFRDYVREFDGVPTQLRGNRLEMSPDRLAAIGLTWAPEQGLFGYATANFIGERYLDKRNRALADSYSTLAAGVGYRFARGEVRLDGDNLSDERPPVAESELGDAQYYLLPARSWRIGARWRF